MAISRKAEEVINKGGAVKVCAKTIPVYKIVCQKVREDVLKHVDEAVLERPGLSRNGWIHEAIQEKLKRIKDVHTD